MTTTFAETLASLRGEDDEIALIAGQPTGDRWVRLEDALCDDATLRRWHAATRASAEAPDKVAMMFLASWLAGTLVEPVATSLVRSAAAGSPIRAPCRSVRPWTAGSTGSRSPMGPSCARGRPGGGTEDVRVLRRSTRSGDASAASIAPILAATLAAFRRVGPIGAPAFWGSVADSIASASVSEATAHGSDPAVAYAEGASLSDAIGQRVAMGRVRPTLVTIPWTGGVAHEVRRGTCCLWYQTQEAPDPRGEGYCTSCPRRDLDDQRLRWARSLEEEAAAVVG